MENAMNDGFTMAHRFGTVIPIETLPCAYKKPVIFVNPLQHKAFEVTAPVNENSKNVKVLTKHTMDSRWLIP